MKTIYTFIILFFFILGIGAQDIEEKIQTLQSRWDNPIKINGAVSATFSFNNINGAQRRRDPFSMNLLGTAAFDIFGIQAPFAVAIADRNTTYNLPSYSFVGISPSYRWAKLHLFRRSMNFSKYTLSGQGFNGAGVELTPGKWKIMGMFGDLRKARVSDFGLRQNLDPIFRRNAWAAGVAYENNEDKIGINLLKAKDDGPSIPGFDSLVVRPQENVVIDIDGRKRISDFLAIQGTLALSMHNPDNTNENRNISGIESFFNVFMQLGSQSALSKAYSFAIDFSPTFGNIALAYERVDPRFVSLGTLYFQNDFENWTASYRGKIKKIGLSTRLGIERNNLAAREIEERNRFVGRIQLTVPFHERWHNSFGFSNFRQTTRLRDRTNPLEIVDSIFLGSTNFQYIWGSSYKINESMSLQGNLVLQNANSIDQEQVSNNASTVRTLSLNYNYAPKGSAWNAGILCLWNQLNNPTTQVRNVSPSLRAAYKVNDQWSNQLALTFNTGKVNEMSNGSVWRMNLSSTYALLKKHNLSFSFQYINRQAAIMPGFSEIQCVLGYSYQFAFFQNSSNPKP